MLLRISRSWSPLNTAAPGCLPEHWCRASVGIRDIVQSPAQYGAIPAFVTAVCLAWPALGQPGTTHLLSGDIATVPASGATAQCVIINIVQCNQLL